MKALQSPITLLSYLLILSLVACTNARIKTGDKMYDNLSYTKAIAKYEKVIEKQPDNFDVKLKLADAHRNLNNSEEAERYYAAVAADRGLEGSDNVRYAQVLMKNNKHGLAEKVLQDYLAINPDDKLAADLLASTQRVDELKEDTSAYELKPLPLDFLVSMFGPAHYGNGIVFAAETEITSAASTNPWTGYSYLDLYYMEKDAKGYWDVPVAFDETLNGRFHDGPATFNKEQDMIIYTRSAMRNQKKQLVNEDRENQFYLYSSEKVDGKWQKPKELPFNSPNYSVGHPSLSDDGKTLYFSSNMPGGYGGSDLYKSIYDGETWSEPINLGNEINTPGNEVFPYAHKSGKLYFSSEGHTTLGGLDVFVSESKGGLWSKPVNLAYPLNSSQDDFAIIFNDNDTTGYVSSNRSGEDMIYSFVQMPPIFILQGIASIKADQLPIDGVTITLINMTDGDTARITTAADGKFKFNLLPNKKYAVKGEKEGYFNLSEEFETGNKSVDKNIDFRFEIDEIVESKSGTGSGTPKDGSETAQKTYDIGNIFYDFDDARIRNDAKPTLDKLTRLLKDNPGINIEIQAHTDARGSDAYNMALSNRRAKAVVDYLVGSGIAKNRLKSKGFGESQPVNKCVDGVECSEEMHQQNRRTEFIVLESKQS